ncbi:MAG TPA: acyl carrier protein [Rhodocyclaceae bacterium]|nr:acyl carrier protein [Rhodocyclaceae bacterium]
MSRDQVQSEILAILNAVLKREATPDSSRKNLPQWDSLKHVEIIFAVEDAFGVQFSEEELFELDSVENIAASIIAKHAA